MTKVAFTAGALREGEAGARAVAVAVDHLAEVTGLLQEMAFLAAARAHHYHINHEVVVYRQIG